METSFNFKKITHQAIKGIRDGIKTTLDKVQDLLNVILPNIPLEAYLVELGSTKCYSVIIFHEK